MNGNIQYIARHYGKSNQTVKAIEELGELIQALAESITKTNSKSSKTLTSHICEECADAWIMIQQVLNLYDISDEEFWSMCNYKINRQVERIKKDG